MDAPTVHTRPGIVSGEWSGGVARFRCIPFAGRVDGPGRFALATAPVSWSGARPCMGWGPVAAQVPDGLHRDHPFYADYLFGRGYPQPMNEDGLYLNLWTRSIDPEARRPVLVWLHGGGFATGVATRPREEGSALAMRGDLVVVAPMHRLGLLGYAYFDGGTAPGRPPNVGLFDILAALAWIQDNIRRFGGDPDNVTIMGESGGAMKVTALLAMPAARGLFHRAICLGGALVRDHAASALSPEQASYLMDRLCGHLNMTAAELVAAPMATLVQAQVATNRRPLLWRPVVDGHTLPGHPDDVLAAGNGAKVPLLIGTSAHEGDCLSRLDPLFDAAKPAGLAELVGASIQTVGPVYSQRAGDATGERDGARALLGDFYLRMPSIRIAEAHQAAGNATFMYLFDWTQPRQPCLRSTHGAETVFIFGNLEATGAVRGFDEAAVLSRQVQDAWIEFIRHGRPGADGTPEWPEYTPAHRWTMHFADPITVAADPGGEFRRAWDDARTSTARQARNE